jgi:hypothetical protein
MKGILPEEKIYGARLLGKVASGQLPGTSKKCRVGTAHHHLLKSWYEGKAGGKQFPRSPLILPSQPRRGELGSPWGEYEIRPYRGLGEGAEASGAGVSPAEAPGPLPKYLSLHSFGCSEGT